MARARPQDNWRRVAALRVLAGILLAVGVCGLMLAMHGLNDQVFPADAAVVAGSEASGEDSLSSHLYWRVEAAYGLYYYGTVKKILVSGGIGRSGFNEAEAMRDYLIELGVNPTDVIVHSGGSDTAATAGFTAAYARECGWQRVIAVSQFFHLPRMVLSLKHEGVPVVGSLAAGHFAMGDFLSLLREIPNYFIYWSEIK